MLVNFRKIGVAAAVASALGASGAANAVLLGAPGDAVLIPFVVTDDTLQLNTVIGVTVASNARTNAGQFADLSVPFPDHPPGFGTLSVPKSDSLGCGRTDAQIHWYFFDMFSWELANEKVDVTCEDFVRLDWNFLTENKFPSARNKFGYMVIGDARANQDTKSEMILYASASVVRGNWASMAYIPVLPLVDSVDGTPGDEVTYASEDFIQNVNPVIAGMLLPSADTRTTASFSLRYYLGPELSGDTTMVFWFPENNSTLRGNQNIVVYDADQTPRSVRTSIPCELNVLNVEQGASPGSGQYASCLGVIADGLNNNTPDGDGIHAVGPAVNTGFVLFNVRDYRSDISKVTPGEGSRAGIAFSLIGVSGAVEQQANTDLAQERGLR
jgi:hypothetical protein